MILLCLGIGMAMRLVYQEYIERSIDNKNQEIIQEIRKIDFTVKGDTVIYEIDSLRQNYLDPEPKLVDIDKVTIKPKKVERSNQLYEKPFHIISISAYSKKEPAMDEASQINDKGLSGNFMWIPDYQDGGKELYKVYIGPFNNRKEAESAKELVKPHFKGCYVQSFK